MTEVDALIGQTVAGRYRITGLLGKGGMGAVYAAVQENLGRDVAVKVILAALARDANVVLRFEREAQVVARLSHPNIVTVHDFGKLDDGALFIVMEHLQGVSLQTAIRAHGRMPWPTSVRIIRDVTAAVAAAHRAGIVHRDLKPENIMLVDAEGRRDFVKVLDFGVAKQSDGLEGAATNLTGSGMIVGTPGYMPPEVLFAGTPADARGDLYAIGLIWLEMLLGRPVYAGGTPASVLVRQATEAPPRLDVSIPDAGVPAEVQRILYQLLEKDPKDRTRDASTLLAELDQALQLTASGNFAVAQKTGGPTQTNVWATSPGVVATSMASGGGTLPYGSLVEASQASGELPPAQATEPYTSMGGLALPTLPQASSSNEPVRQQTMASAAMHPTPSSTSTDRARGASRGLALGGFAALVVAFTAGLLLSQRGDPEKAVSLVVASTPPAPVVTAPAPSPVTASALPVAAPSQADAEPVVASTETPTLGAPDDAAVVEDVEAPDEKPARTRSPAKAPREKAAAAAKAALREKARRNKAEATAAAAEDPAPSTTKGALTSARVKEAIVRSFGKAQDCTNTNIKAAPSGPGLLIDHCPSYPTLDQTHTIVLTVDPSGTVSGARFKDAAAASSKIGRCVVESVKRWSFPAFDGDAPVEITQRVTFEPCVPINNKCVF
jgi:serine/threonine protein kinase